MAAASPVWLRTMSPMSIVPAYGRTVNGTGVTTPAHLNTLTGSGRVLSYGLVTIIASGRIVTPNV